jgi:hypothetical protein
MASTFIGRHATEPLAQAISCESLAVRDGFIGALREYPEHRNEVSGIQVRSRVALGIAPPGPPTDPDVPFEGIRLLFS